MPDLAIPIDYISAAEKPPHPLTKAQMDKRREDAENCVCPFLKTGYVTGKLDADKAGYVSIEQVYAMMDWAGVGRAAFPQEGYFNKFGISGVPVLHLSRNRPNDSLVLHAHIGQEERQKRMDDFLSYANADGEFTYIELEKAAEAWCLDLEGGCDSLFGPRGEFATILTTFGRIDKSEKYLTKQDLTDLWINNVWPEDFDLRRQPEKGPVTTIDLSMLWRFIKMKRQVEEPKEKELGHPVTVASADQKYEFRPYDVYPVSDTPGEPALTEQQVKDWVKGGELCLFDSRVGGIQEVRNHTRWVFTPDMFQTTIAEQTGIDPNASSGPPPLLIIIIVLAAGFFGYRRFAGSSKEPEPVGEAEPLTA